MRNLNNFEIMGRNLKVDYSNDNSGGKGGQNDQHGSNRAPPPAHFDMGQPLPMMPNGGAQDLPPLPQGVDPPLGLTAPDAISKTLSAIPPPQLLDIISQMKTLVATEPQKATAILQQAPQLGFAIFQALMLLGLVDANIVGSLLQQQPQQPPQPQHAPQYAQAPAYGQAPPPNPYGAPVPPYQAMQHPGYAPTPPQQPVYQPPPQQQQAYQAPPQQDQSQQQQLIQQVLSMTRDQIYSLDEQSRNQLIALRAQLGAPVS